MKMYHIALSEQDVGEYAILTGDPGRVESMAKILDDGHVIASNREYKTASGFICGKKTVITSVGIGGPSMAIGVEELVKLGCKTFIRLGTSGGISQKVRAGDIIVANAAVRQDGTGSEYVPLSFPAVADFSVTTALANASKKVLNGKGMYHVGTVQSKDSFFGEMEPERMPVKEYLLNLWEVYKRTGVLASEMECSTLFLLGAVLGVKTGAALLCIWNEERKKHLGDSSEVHDTAPLFSIARTALESLILNEAH